MLQYLRSFHHAISSTFMAFQQTETKLMSSGDYGGGCLAEEIEQAARIDEALESTAVCLKAGLINQPALLFADQGYFSPMLQAT
jgi:hypothetical protein